MVYRVYWWEVFYGVTKFKALFLSAEKPYDDMGDIVQIARAEACKILRTDKVKVLNILSCSYPLGFVAVVSDGMVVQSSGGKHEKKRLESEC